MGALYRLNQLARIAQQIAALGEGLLLPAFSPARSSSAIWNSKLSMRRAFSASSIWRAAISRRRTAKSGQRPPGIPPATIPFLRIHPDTPGGTARPGVAGRRLPVDIEELPAQLP